MIKGHRQWTITFAAAGPAILVLALIFAPGAADAAVEISTKPTANMNCSGGVCTPTAKKAVLNVGDLANMLSSGDLTVESGALAQDIEIDATLSWTTTSRLTLDSFDSISFNKPVEVMGAGALTISTNDGGSGGDFRFLGNSHVKFWDLDSSLIIDGNKYALAKNIRGIHRLGQFVALARSIDVGRKTYTSSPIQSFGGILEGLGNTISHLTIHAVQGQGGGGLIGTVYGVVRDIGVVSVDITTGDVSGGGALAAENAFGGIIANSFATGQISAGSRSAAGGLVGVSSGAISSSHAAVMVSAGDDSKVGGLVAGFNGENTFAPIAQSYATGSVSGGNNASVGGLVGSNIGGVFSNSYSTGPVTGGSGAFVGGLIGSNANYSGVGSVSDSYSLSSVSGGQDALLGGLIGDDESSDSIASIYWDLDTSGISNPAQGAGNVANAPGITGLTTEQFKSGLPAGFDKKVWKEKSNINNGYPYLIDLPPN